MAATQSQTAAMEFSHSNAKVMATALFFEYLSYSVFAIYDSVMKDTSEYVYVNDEVAAQAKEQAQKDKERKAKEKEEKKKQKNNKPGKGTEKEGKAK